MLSDEILAKIKKIEISTRRIISDVVSGQYKSHFRGHGMQFSEHRIYQPGDDIRHIDWKASARNKDLLVKKYEEERELTVMLAVDMSASENFGSDRHLKSEVVAEIAGMIAYAAVQNGDRVGAVFFTDVVEKIIPPKKGKQHVLRLIRDLLVFKAQNKKTSIATGLTSVHRLMKNSGIVFLISDFIDGNYKQEIIRISRKSDMVALWIVDPIEELPSFDGLVRAVDPESGEEYYIDSRNHSYLKWKEARAKERTEGIKKELSGSKSELLKISTKEDYGEAVVKFFMERKKGRFRH